MSMGLTNIISQLSAKLTGDWAFLNPVIEVLRAALIPILILVGTAGMIYAIVLGVKLARAETTEQRDEAKKRLINAIIALVVMIALILLLELFVNNIDNWVGNVAKPDDGASNPEDTPAAGSIISYAMAMLRM